MQFTRLEKSYAPELSRFEQAVDRVIGVFSPSALLRRELAREERMSVMALRDQRASFARHAHDAAAPSRRWDHRNLSKAAQAPHKDVDEDELPVMRARAADVVANDGLARTTIDSMVDRVVGSGLRPRLELPWQELGLDPAQAVSLSRSASLLWDEFCTTADNTNRHHFGLMQAFALASCLERGDVLAVPVMRNDPRVASRFELKIQLLEGDLLDTPQGVRAARDRDIRNGVEIGSQGQPVGYWVTDTYEGEAIGTRRFRRYAAHNAQTGRPNVLHVFYPHRLNASRGRPLLAPVLALFRDLGDFLEARLIAAQVASCFAAFVVNNDPVAMANQRRAESQGRASGTTAAGNGPRDEEVSAGGIHYLNHGEDVRFAQPSTGGSDLDAFVDLVSRRITSATGQPFEIATRNFKGTTYAQARAALLEATRAYRRRRHWLVQSLLQPVFVMMLQEAWLKGMWAAPADFARRPHLWTRARWLSDGEGWVDPAREAQAEETRLRSGQASLTDLVASREGWDIEDVFARRHAERQLAESLGLPDPYAEQAAVASSSTSDESDEDESTDQDAAQGAQASAGADPAQVKARLDAAGVAIRSGLLTPQADDEAATREALGMPGMTPEVADAWDAEPVRRPVTLASPKDAATEVEAQEDEPEPSPFGGEGEDEPVAVPAGGDDDDPDSEDEEPTDE